MIIQDKSERHSTASGGGEQLLTASCLLTYSLPGLRLPRSAIYYILSNCKEVFNDLQFLKVPQ